MPRWETGRVFFVRGRVESAYGAKPLRTTSIAIAAGKKPRFNLEVDLSRRILSGPTRLYSSARPYRSRRGPVFAWVSRLHRNRPCLPPLGSSGMVRLLGAIYR